VADRLARLVNVATTIAISFSAATLALQLLKRRAGLFVTPAQTLTPFVVVVALATAIVAIIRGHYLSAGAGVALVLVFLALIAPLVFRRRLGTGHGSGRLRVLHANLLYTNATIERTVAELVAADADVIAVSELTPEFAEMIAASPLGASHPFTALASGPAATGLGIWSRTRLIPATPIAGTRMTLIAGVELDGRPLRIVLTHPVPPLWHPPRWRGEIDAFERDEPHQLASSAVVGDFNAGYLNPPYRRMLRIARLTDVHDALGRGFTRSWPTGMALPAFVRLDHAAVGSDLTATEIVDLDLPGSDHLAFVVTLAWSVSPAD
jgi:endonuclease/exonuclease/phosphatase (EEP) superfamily protein YafD